MKFYFSGIAGKEELSMLLEAGVSRLLVDPWQLQKLKELPAFLEFDGEIMLDSGAYYAHKNGVDYDVYLKVYHQAVGWCVGQPQWTWRVAPDVIDDPKKSYKGWATFAGFPVWHWGEDDWYLQEYLVKTKDPIGIGLAKLMREKDEKMLDDLLALCRVYRGRFHIFGCNWPKAIEQLSPYAYSADSSVWLRGARYAYAIFQHTGHGHLTQAPARFIPEYKGLDRRGRCVQNARNIERFCNNGDL